MFGMEIGLRVMEPRVIFSLSSRHPPCAQRHSPYPQQAGKQEWCAQGIGNQMPCSATRTQLYLKTKVNGGEGNVLRGVPPLMHEAGMHH